MTARTMSESSTPHATLAQVKAAQGTRNSNVNPWESYAADFDEKLSPELEAEIAGLRYHDKSSSQNEEELARWKELNDGALGEYRWCTKEEYADVEARMGRLMHSTELINKLRNELKLKCWYREHPQEDKITLVVQRKEGLPLEVGCWVKQGWMPEYTVMGFDDHGVPLAEKYRGWRTAILQLILKGFTTEEKAHRVFGPAERCCADRYNSVLFGVRNTIKTD
jgi:hypothetical protein